MTLDVRDHLGWRVNQRVAAIHLIVGTLASPPYGHIVTITVKAFGRVLDRREAVTTEAQRPQLAVQSPALDLILTSNRWIGNTHMGRERLIMA